jgi:hypothetical protein
MAYSKRVWSDRTVERPLTYILQNNPDGTVTLIPSEGSIIQVGTPLTAANLNNMENGLADHDGRIITAEGKIATNEGKIATSEGNISSLLSRMSGAEGQLARKPNIYAEQGDGAFIMQRASNSIYGKLSPNANFLVSVTDTAYSTRYLVFVVHWQYMEILSIHMLAQATLGVVQNTMGTISVSGLAGQAYFTFMGLT